MFLSHRSAERGNEKQEIFLQLSLSSNGGRLYFQRQLIMNYSFIYLFNHIYSYKSPNCCHIAQSIMKLSQIMKKIKLQ